MAVGNLQIVQPVQMESPQLLFTRRLAVLFEGDRIDQTVAAVAAALTTGATK